MDILLNVNKPFIAHQVTFMRGKIEFFPESKPVDWDVLIGSFTEDDTRIQCITPIEPFEGYKMLVACVNAKYGNTFYVIKADACAEMKSEKEESCNYTVN